MSVYLNVSRDGKGSVSYSENEGRRFIDCDRKVTIPGPYKGHVITEGSSSVNNVWIKHLNSTGWFARVGPDVLELGCEIEIPPLIFRFGKERL